LANLCTVLDEFDYAFAENGLTAYKMGKPLESQSFIKHVGEDQYKVLVNFILHYIADMDIPIKRRAILFSFHDFKYLGDFSGTFVEFRNGMINVSPIGRNATYVPPSVSTAIYGI
jgi:phosphomannomutase